MSDDPQRTDDPGDGSGGPDGPDGPDGSADAPTRRAGEDPGERRSRILLAIRREANRERLAAWLSDRYAVETIDDRSPREALDGCDLCLVDGASFSRHREELSTAKDAVEPIFLPYLLVLTGRGPGDVPDDVWAVVDDVIETPIRKAELGSRIEAALRARRYSVELKRQNDRLERFADIVSHDLRNPLAVAQGFTEVARAGDDPDAFDRVDRALDRMEAIIDDVLAVARTGAVVGETEPIPLADVAETAWQTVATGGATLDVAIDDRVIVRGDLTRTTELFENLFRNSVEHSSTGSRPEADDSVEHSSTGSAARPPDDGAGPAGADVTVRVGMLGDADGFYVEDDGPGIPEDERESVFEYGYTTADDGTGFGLAIVRAVVDAHDWSIRVAEAGDGGARFEITCETRRGADPQPTAAAEDAARRD